MCLSFSPAILISCVFTDVGDLMYYQFKAEKEQREKDMIHAGVEFDKCGLSAVQTLEGEDPDKLSRTAQQHAQVTSCSSQRSRFTGMARVCVWHSTVKETEE